MTKSGAGFFRSIACGLLAASCLGACDELPEGTDEVTLTLAEFSTAPDPEAAGFRVQMRARVTAGLEELEDAVQGGTASAQVCLDGACVQYTVASGAAASTCPGMPVVNEGGTQLSISRAWLATNVVAFDFCVVNLIGQRQFQSVVRFGPVSSNIIFTTCLPPAPTCQSA
jgi:hypothetical protein